MKIKKVNELYQQEPKSNDPGANYYTFRCDVTVKASSLEEAEDKMSLIANNPDFDLGQYDLSVASEGGEAYNGPDLIRMKKSTPALTEKKKMDHKKKVTKAETCKCCKKCPCDGSGKKCKCK